MGEMLITFERFEELIAKEQELNALDQAGVQNWEGYDNAMGIYQELIKINQ